MRGSSLPAGLLLACLAASGVAQPRTYIRCDKPVTCSVSYGDESVVLEVQAQEACDVQVWTGFRPQWAFLNGARAKEGWSGGEEGTVIVHATTGNSAWEFGRGAWPLRGAGPPAPVKVDGRQRSTLATTFSARRLEAQGQVQAPLGLYRVTLIPAYPLPAAAPLPKLQVGDTEVAEWEDVLAATERRCLQARSDLLIADEAGLRLTWPGSFARSPVREVLLQTVATAAALATVEAPDLNQPGLIVIEAEDFKREGGGGPAEISRGQHADQHGGASVFSFGPGAGHWLEWEFQGPNAGRYALYARTATQEPFSLRALMVDRKTPFPAAALLRFPGTGGWARDDAKQWVWTALAGAGGRPPLDLSAGEHRLRLTTVGAAHLNVDVLVLVPVK